MTCKTHMNGKSFFVFVVVVALQLFIECWLRLTNQILFARFNFICTKTYDRQAEVGNKLQAKTSNALSVQLIKILFGRQIFRFNANRRNKIETVLFNEPRESVTIYAC